MIVDFVHYVTTMCTITMDFFSIDSYSYSRRECRKEESDCLRCWMVSNLEFVVCFDVDDCSRGGFQFVRHLNRNKYDVTLVSRRNPFIAQKHRLFVRKIITGKCSKINCGNETTAVRFLFICEISICQMQSSST